jgi:RNA polymerase sigma factor (sigma-70 family)
MSNTSLSDEKILEGIVKKDRKIINYVCSKFKPQISGWIKKNSGTPYDSDDIFQQAFLILFRKINIEGEKLKLSCNLSTYFFSVCKHLWFQELRKRLRFHSKDIEAFRDLLISDSDDDIDDIKFKIFVKQLKELDPRCRRLLLLCCKSKSLTEIKKTMGFKNNQAVADKKKNCRKKIITNLLNSKEYRDLQNEIYIHY